MSWISEALQTQSKVAAELGVARSFDAKAEVAARVAFLARYAREAGAKALVLGISGGVDSTVAGRLCQLAVQALRADGADARFVAMRLPYGTQADESDARRALDFIEPDELMVVDVKPSADASMDMLVAAGLDFDSPAQRDFVLGNIKARQRMVAQYAVAGARGGLVVGTDHAAEALMGFFTKFGDGGFDLTALGGLTKRRVRALAVQLGADQALAMKTPTADLESLRPQLPDEAALGVTYEQVDDFLEGLDIERAAFEKIWATYGRTAHKRALPAAPP